jgi:hypothetical protein
VNWKRLILAAAGFGAGFAAFVAAIGAGVYWYANRPKPWNKSALTATFATLEFDTRPQATSYKVDLLYDVQNTTQQQLRFSGFQFHNFGCTGRRKRTFERVRSLSS